MSNKVRNLLFILLFAGIFTACSSSQKSTSGDTGDVSSIYPAWYSPSGFSSDSASFHGFATAISSDSTIAIANAELQARANLESAIAEKLEEVRISLEEDGNSVATRTDFILALRNAHNAVQEAAIEEEGEARSKAGYFTGYSKVSITKSELKTLLESGFTGKTSYWNALSSSAAFTQEMN
ncbi:MAG: hypothetical protein CL670_09705 [Balneola sp.]|jgi:hypothetical protein|nr:hypothetical protein [Balneola sp.]MBE79417.1 hypothetical protein [Balneola sp.]|tara:strand:- start:280 stop:822 length:543 start_codon:yes stop_codon:yes gene_type:complete